MRLEGTGLQVWETLPLYRLDAEACWERTPAGVRLALTDPEGSPPGPAGVAEGRF